MDPCSETTGWSIFAAATPHSTLAGVLAGFLVIGTLGFLATFSRLSFHILSLFASGVPALAIASYLFSLIAGANAPEGTESQSSFCAQAWSQGLVSIGMLAVGGAVLVCGLGWAIVSYGALYAERMTGKASSTSITRRLILAVQMSGWLSGAIIAATAGLLVSANLVYWKSIASAPLIVGVLIIAFGIYGILISTHIVVRRTVSARDVFYPDRGIGPNRSREWAPLELVFAVATGVVLAEYLQGRLIAEDAISVAIPLLLIFACQLCYVLVRRKLRVTPPGVTREQLLHPIYIAMRWWSTSADITGHSRFEVESSPSPLVFPRDGGGQGETLVNEFEGNISLDRIFHSSFNVVLLAVAGGLYAALLTQVPLSEGLRVFLTLFLGGLYPASILFGLSYTVPAATKMRLPKWKKDGWTRFLP